MKLTEKQIFMQIKIWMAGAPASDLAWIAQRIFGGKFTPIEEVAEDGWIYEFEPDEHYTGTFDTVKSK